MRRYTIFGLWVCAMVFAMVAAPGSSSAQTSGQQISLTLTEFMITPMDLTVTKGQVVNFSATNTGKFPHNVTFLNGTEKYDLFAQPLKPGESGTATFTFTEAGTWKMYCPVGTHADKGMVGAVTVMAQQVTAPGMPTTGQGADQSLFVAGLAGLALLSTGLVVRRKLASRKI